MPLTVIIVTDDGGHSQGLLTVSEQELEDLEAQLPEGWEIEPLDVIDEP